MYDIVATTDNKTIINGVYKLPVGSSPTKEQLMSTLPVAYKKATTDKKLNTFEDLCNADLLAFGSKIGQITNKGSAIFAMLPLYDKDSEEYKELEKRLVLIRVAQGDEIDKAKGVKVKEFPKHWTSYTSKDNEFAKNTAETTINTYNNIIIDKKPYFFKHRYSTDKKAYDKYMKGRENYCKITYGCTIDELKSLKYITDKQIKFLESVDKFSPLIESDCVMNNLSKYMEQFVKSLNHPLFAPNAGRKKGDIKNYEQDIYKQYLSNPDLAEINEEIYNKAKKIVLEYFKKLKEKVITIYPPNEEPEDNKTKKPDVLYEDLKKELFKLRSDYRLSNSELTDILIYLFYTDITGKNKNILWRLCGKYIYQNVLKTTRYYYYPAKCIDDDLDNSKTRFEYMNDLYELRLVDLNNNVLAGN